MDPEIDASVTRYAECPEEMRTIGVVFLASIVEGSVVFVGVAAYLMRDDLGGGVSRLSLALTPLFAIGVIVAIYAINYCRKGRCAAAIVIDTGRREFRCEQIFRRGVLYRPFAAPLVTKSFDDLRWSHGWW